MPPKKSSKSSPKRRKGSKTAPAQPRPGSRAFKRLQKQWYAKLKRGPDPFRDIEGGQERGFLYGQSMTDVRFQERLTQQESPTRHYFRRWSCFLAWHDKGQLTPIEREVIKLYSDGIAYADILKHLKSIGLRTNHFQLHYLIERLEAAIDKWNRTNPNGLDYVSDLGD